MRSFVLGLALFSLSCGDSTSAFTLQIIGSSGGGDRIAVQGSAVDQIILILDPALNVRFPPRPEESYEDGDVLTRVAAAGEFVITLQQAYLERNVIPRPGGGFEIDVPLHLEAEMMGEVPDPSLMVQFIQRDATGTAEIIATFTRGLAWPLVDGEMESVTVSCLDGFETQCARE